VHVAEVTTDEQPLRMIWLGTPAYVGEKLALVVEVREPDAAVRVYGVNTTPAKVQFETVTMPLDAVRPEQAASVPSEGVNVITAWDDVTMFPAESSTLTIGWVANAAPDTPATGEVVKSS
jgi:hypothetical protein